MTSEHRPISSLKWTLTEAAQQCSVSRSTIRRYRESGKFPNAEKQSGQWVIPVSDLIAAGLNPGQPNPPNKQPKESEEQSKPEQGEQAQEIAELRAQLAIEQAHRKAAEQVAAERERSLNDLRQALRMIEPPRQSFSEKTAESTQIEQLSTPQNSETAKPESWWKRLFK